VSQASFYGNMLDRGPTMTKPFNVLFLCTGNSARSIMAEVILRRWGRDRFNAFSAGSHPHGTIHPMTIETLKRLHYSTEGLRSKNWSEFAQSDAPALDFVFTVCDRAAGEVCPVWPGQPMTAHWGVDDPAAAEVPEDKQREAFRRAYLELDSRIKIFTSLPLAKLDRLSLQKRLDQIGRTQHADGELPKTGSES
jgi:protein-tyrosine-phosphatase